MLWINITFYFTLLYSSGFDARYVAYTCIFLVSTLSPELTSSGCSNQVTVDSLLKNLIHFSLPWILQEGAIHNERHVKVICIGARASGLCLAYKLQRSFRNYTLTVRMKFEGKKSDLEEIILTIFF
jgi:hypothetical protein